MERGLRLNEKPSQGTSHSHTSLECDQHVFTLYLFLPIGVIQMSRSYPSSGHLYSQTRPNYATNEINCRMSTAKGLRKVTLVYMDFKPTF